MAARSALQQPVRTLKTSRPANVVKGLHSKAKADTVLSEGFFTGTLQASGFKNPLYQFENELSPTKDIPAVTVSFFALHSAL